MIGVDLKNAEGVANLGTREGRNQAIANIKKHCVDHIDHFVAAAGVSGQVKNLPLIIGVDYFGVIDILDGLFDLLRFGDRPSAVLISSNSCQMLSPNVSIQYPLIMALLDHNEEEANRIAKGLNDIIMFDGDPIPRLRAGIVYLAAKNAVARAARQRVTLWGNAGVRLNVVAPGMTLTPMLQQNLDDPRSSDKIRALPVPLKRLANPDEQAAVIAFLLGNEASYVHGAVIFNDGGVDAMGRPDLF